MERLTVLKGTLDVLVLKTLAWGPMHGFEITTWLEENARHGLDLEDAALYQALRRMEERGYVEAEMGVTENNRKARYYQLTAKGRAHLKSETSNWMRYAEMVSSILTRPVPAGRKA
ncbi:MAG: PadR family transcriptional regulator [Gemmatimonadaceae bacterium]